MQQLLEFKIVELKFNTADNNAMSTLKELISEAHTIVPKISCEEFLKRSAQYVLIDVREGTEILETGMLDNAINIPRGLIEMKLSPESDGFNANTPIVVYCGGGSRASLAGKTLKELGFKSVYNLDGGYRGWKEFTD